MLYVYSTYTHFLLVFNYRLNLNIPNSFVPFYSADIYPQVFQDAGNSFHTK